MRPLSLSIIIGLCCAHAAFAADLSKWTGAYFTDTPGYCGIEVYDAGSGRLAAESSNNNPFDVYSECVHQGVSGLYDCEGNHCVAISSQSSASLCPEVTLRLLPSGNIVLHNPCIGETFLEHKVGSGYKMKRGLL